MSNAALNSGGNHVAFMARIRDNTGITNTVAASATPAAIVGALFAEVYNSPSSGLSWDAATGRLTVAQAAARGKYLVTVASGSAQGPTTSTHGVAVWAGPASAMVEVGGRATKVEPTGGNASGEGVAQAIVDFAAVGDRLEVRTRVGADGNAVVYRDLTLSVVRISD